VDFTIFWKYSCRHIVLAGVSTKNDDKVHTVVGNGNVDTATYKP